MGKGTSAIDQAFKSRSDSKPMSIECLCRNTGKSYELSSNGQSWAAPNFDIETVEIVGEADSRGVSVVRLEVRVAVGSLAELISVKAKKAGNCNCGGGDGNGDENSRAGCYACHPNSCYRRCWDSNGNEYWRYDAVCCP